jgi:putative DNA methylase
MSTHRKKLIEVALPLDEINAACKREKSIRHGHPSTLHLWWARRPLAAARAVIFAQMVDDPSSIPGLSEKEIVEERERLFDIIRNLVKWENTTNEAVLEEARAEIRKSWARTCEETGEDPNQLPAFHDPFAGGGALPLEAQRLGLESYASDLNPVAVLINKAMIEIPPKFAGMPPVNPEARGEKSLIAKQWTGAEGLAEDVRYYGEWIRNEAEKRIGHHYPKVTVTHELARNRPDLADYVGQELTVMAFIWCRTVPSPNPAFSHVEVPLASTFLLSAKRGQRSYVEPVVEGDTYRFDVRAGDPVDLPETKAGTTAGKRQGFRCILSGAPITYDWVKSHGKATGFRNRLLAVVAEGRRGRIYLSPTAAMESLGASLKTHWKPEVALEGKCRVNVANYGLDSFGDLFTERQSLAMATFSDLVLEAKGKVTEHIDELTSHVEADYASAVSIYLALVVSSLADRMSTICTWDSGGPTWGTKTRNTFARQALPMSWDFAEVNPFSSQSGSFANSLGYTRKGISQVGKTRGTALQADAMGQSLSRNCVVSTDPPYYDNIMYADLSDFFYVWLRRCLRDSLPTLFATIGVPKANELVASPARHSGKQKAEAFFLVGMTKAMHQVAGHSHPEFPVTVYYAFKQSELKGDQGLLSTGWETFLTSLCEAGFALTGTWPMRTELGNRMIGSGKNALASSIVLVCRKQSEGALTVTRRDFLRDLRKSMPNALADLQRANLAPVDLAQCSIGPGMAVFSKYRKVIEADGSSMTVRSALQLINQVLDESLGAEEGQLDGDTRFAVTWFETYQYNKGPFGEADNLARARAVSVDGVAEAGVLQSAAGQVQLFTRPELPADWDPAKDKRLTVWEATQHLIKRLEEEGEQATSALLKALGATVAEQARNLSYRLYTICERKKWAEEARAYNGLVLAWPELEKLAASNATTATTPTQASLEL